jgi:hypothetical protein
MKITDLIASGLEGNLAMVKLTLGDFTDADMVVRPVPGANNAAWQLGHLIVAETNLISIAAPDAMPKLPPGIAEKFGKEGAKTDDPAALAGKEELLALFEKTRNGTLAWTRSLTPEQLDQPIPEKYHRLGKTWGAMAAFQTIHATMHLGQFQVIRRKLGKPVLF